MPTSRQRPNENQPLPNHARHERQEVWTNVEDRESRRNKLIVVTVAIVVPLPAIVTILYAMTLPIPEYCGPWVDGAPAYISTVETGGVPGNLTASWSMTCVTERFSAISSIELEILMDGAFLGSDAQNLRFDTIISFNTNVKVIVRDMDNNGRLSGSDTFLVYGMSGAHHWKLFLNYVEDYSTIMTRVNWDTQ